MSKKHSDDEFEQLLQEFINSQIEVKSSEQPAEEEMPTEEPESTEEDMPTEEPEPESEPDLLLSLNSLTGLESVKTKLRTYEKVVQFNCLRRDNGLPDTSLPLHAMFLGSPGTGKTTVARRMGVMLHRAGALSRGHVVMRERSSLLGPYYSTEETKTLEAIDEAQGGILFIDEAYQLYQPEDPRDPGKFVIETLMSALADESRRDWMLILAGYPDEMRRMFDLNPGLKSRIPDSNLYIFEDFTEAQLMEIAENYFKRNKFVLSPEARVALATRLGADYAARSKNFGNARHVMNLIQTEILPAMAIRVMAVKNPSGDALSTILPCDIPAPIKAVTSSRSRLGFRA